MLRIVILAILLISVMHKSYANSIIQKDDEGTFSLTFENDYFADEDNGYTNGFRFSYLSPETQIPNWLKNIEQKLPFFAKNGKERYSFAFGQTMYTPDDITIASLIKDDRPYAAFLYTSAGITSDTGSRLDNLSLTLGMVGPSAAGEKVQEEVHHFINYLDPKGWDNQLKDEPGVILSYERKWRAIYEAKPFGFGVDVTPTLGMSLGNIHTYANAGATVRVGRDLPSDYGPPLIRPNMPGSDFFHPSKDFGWYVFSGIEGRAVARNIFLDGNSFQDSHSVDKNYFVGGLQGGIAFTVGDVRIAYTHILRTKEFKGQKNPDEFGAISISYRF